MPVNLANKKFLEAMYLLAGTRELMEINNMYICNKNTTATTQRQTNQNFILKITDKITFPVTANMMNITVIYKLTIKNTL